MIVLNSNHNTSMHAGGFWFTAHGRISSCPFWVSLFSHWFVSHVCCINKEFFMKHSVCRRGLEGIAYPLLWRFLLRAKKITRKARRLSSCLTTMTRFARPQCSCESHRRAVLLSASKRPYPRVFKVSSRTDVFRNTTEHDSIRIGR